MRIVSDQDNDSKMVIYFKLVTESFRDFCKSEMLTDEKLYDADSIHGLQVCSIKLNRLFYVLKQSRKPKKVLNLKNFHPYFVFIY
jgi:hypothetical protein